MIQQTTLCLKPRPRGCHLITQEVLAHLPQPLPEVGVLHLFVQHTSCALSLNENADPEVCACGGIAHHSHHGWPAQLGHVAGHLFVRI